MYVSSPALALDFLKANANLLARWCSSSTSLSSKPRSGKRPSSSHHLLKTSSSFFQPKGWMENCSAASENTIFRKQVDMDSSIQCKRLYP